ncbi:MAG: hypothetical protein RMI34_12975 [Chloroherpetonaceae bacterium]|nr:hypothetical protein [Chloroherpetonaceae bacterium]MDW8020970.1 hypothetical protein [Chloroherpetonaceae bacterium]
MKTLRKTNDQIDLRLTPSEIVMLCNALNEVINGIEVAEFELRLGASLSEAQALLTELRAVLPTSEVGEQTK